MKKTAFFLLAILIILVTFNLERIYQLSEEKSAQPPTRLVIWGFPNIPGFQGVRGAIRYYDRQHPDVKIILGTPGGKGDMDPQKLLTAIAGGTPPDVLRQDRFAVASWAAKDAFRPLDDLIEKSHFPWNDFYAYARKEATYKGKIYGIPYDTDSRALYYNKTLFRQAGLDPERPPRTWKELTDCSIKLTKRNAKGQIEQLGFAPYLGEGWFYIWSWANGGQLLSPDGTRVTFDTPENLGALTYVTQLCDTLGGRIEDLARFESGFGRIGTIVDPFLQGKLGMFIMGSWYLQTISRYKLHMDFGVAPMPVPEGRPPVTWSGGFSFVIPRNAKHVREAWDFIEWMSSLEAAKIVGRLQKEYNARVGYKVNIPEIYARRSLNDYLTTHELPKYPRFGKAYLAFVNLLNYSHYRPVTPVAQILWDAQVRVEDRATFHFDTPRRVLQKEQMFVQQELNKILHKPNFPILNFKIIYGIFILIVVSLIFWFGYRLRNERRRGPLVWEETRSGFLFALPWMLGFFTFILGPIIASILFSFTRYDVLHPAKFVGLLNYKELFWFTKSSVSGKIVPTDPLFWKSLWNTAYITIFGVPLSIVIGLAIALFLNRESKGIGIYRTLYYLPSIVPIVAAAILWLWLLNPSTGLLARFLGLFGITSPNWMADPHWTKPAILLILLWGAGGGMVIWLAGLKNIPKEMYEAAKIDGANAWQQFWKITIPFLTPYIFFNLVIGIIGYLQIFTRAYVITGLNSPDNSLLFYVYYLFNNAFMYFKMGYASAMAWILFVIILVLTLINLKLSKKWVFYQEG